MTQLRLSAIARVAGRKLAQLNAAATLQFLQAPPGNRLEALSGNRAGQHSIRINDIVHERRGVTADTARRATLAAMHRAA